MNRGDIMEVAPIEEFLRAIDEAKESAREAAPYYAELQLRMMSGTEIAEENKNA